MLTLRSVQPRPNWNGSVWTSLMPQVFSCCCVHAIACLWAGELVSRGPMFVVRNSKVSTAFERSMPSARIFSMTVKSTLSCAATAPMRNTTAMQIPNGLIFMRRILLLRG